MKPRLSDLVDAFEMQGDGATQYLDLESGRVILVTEDFQHYEDAGDSEDDLPEWMQEAITEVLRIRAEPERYLELPAQGEFVNRETLRSFCDTLSSPVQRDRLLATIRGKGAFRRFKDVADEVGVLPDWFAFRRSVLEACAIQWCEENGVAFDRGAA